MKKISLIAQIVSLFLFLPSGIAHGQSGVVFSFGNGNPGMPACSATVTMSCLTSLTLSDITTPNSPVVVSSTISPSATSYTETPLPSVGSHTWSLVVNGKDQSGASISSSPVTLTLTVPSLTLNPPTGFSGVP